MKIKLSLILLLSFISISLWASEWGMEDDSCDKTYHSVFTSDIKLEPTEETKSQTSSSPTRSKGNKRRPSKKEDQDAPQRKRGKKAPTAVASSSSSPSKKEAQDVSKSKGGKKGRTAVASSSSAPLKRRQVIKKEDASVFTEEEWFHVLLLGEDYNLYFEDERVRAYLQQEYKASSSTGSLIKEAFFGYYIAEMAERLNELLSVHQETLERIYLKRNDQDHKKKKLYLSEADYQRLITEDRLRNVSSLLDVVRDLRETLKKKSAYLRSQAEACLEFHPSPVEAANDNRMLGYLQRALRRERLAAQGDQFFLVARSEFPELDYQVGQYAASLDQRREAYERLIQSDSLTLKSLGYLAYGDVAREPLIQLSLYARAELLLDKVAGSTPWLSGQSALRAAKLFKQPGYSLLKKRILEGTSGEGLANNFKPPLSCKYKDLLLEEADFFEKLKEDEFPFEALKRFKISNLEEALELSLGRLEIPSRPLGSLPLFLRASSLLFLEAYEQGVKLAFKNMVDILKGYIRDFENPSDPQNKEIAEVNHVILALAQDGIHRGEPETWHVLAGMDSDSTSQELSVSSTSSFQYLQTVFFRKSLDPSWELYQRALETLKEKLEVVKSE